MSPRRLTRRRGSEMMGSLLYAAFAVAVILGVLTLYQTVRLHTTYRETAQTLVSFAEDGRQRETAGVTTDEMLDQLIVAHYDDFAKTMPRAMNVFSGGQDTAYGRVQFSYSAYFTDASDEAAIRLCNRFRGSTANYEKIQSGPFGTNYTVLGSCTGGFPHFQVLYFK